MSRSVLLRAVAPAVLLVSFAVGLTAALSAVAWWRSLSADLDERLEAARIALPSRAYARPLVIVPGDRPSRLRLDDYLRQVGYRSVQEEPSAPGEYRPGEERWEVWARGYRGPESHVAAARVTLALDRRGRITKISRADGRALSSLTIEPPMIGLLAGPEPRDYDPVPLEEMPPELVHAFLAIEDLRFFEHPGIDVQRVIGAALANLRAGEITQGGSTITSSGSRTPCSLPSAPSTARCARRRWPWPSRSGAARRRSSRPT